MNSSGAHYRGSSVVGADIYANRNYESHLVNSSLTPYIAPYGEQTSNSSYCHSHYNNQSHSFASHYNSCDSQSSQVYGSPHVNHYSDMYSIRNAYAANLHVRAQSNSSNVKYWNTDQQQIPHNSHNYSSGSIPPPPLVSRTQTISSPTLRSPQYSTPSPQGWSRSPNVMHSPSATPSPSLHTRSPSHVQTQQYSPSHPSSLPSHAMSESMPQKTHELNVPYSNQNSTSSQSSSGTNPLQSLQKMVMIDAESSEVRTGFDDSLHNTVDSANLDQMHNSYNNGDANVNDPDSPYPTYYNLDQNRLCTPPHPNFTSVSTYPNIPVNQTDVFASNDARECKRHENKKENKCERIDNNNKTSDLISNTDSKNENTSKFDSNERSNVLNGEKEPNSSMADKDVQSCNRQSQKINHEQSISTICSRTSSKDSDSDNMHTYTDSRPSHWQMNQTDKSDHYFNSNNNNNMGNKNIWWSQNNNNNIPHSSQQSLPQNSNSIPHYMPEASNHTSTANSVPFQPPVMPSTSWTPESGSSCAPPLMSPNKQFTPKNNPKEAMVKKKRGRPFGSKNRRRESEDIGSEGGSETATSDSRSQTALKKRKKSFSTEEIGINTNVSIDAHNSDEIAVINAAKQTSGASKKKKYLGPVIRIEKGKANNSKIYSIVNTSNKPDDDKDLKGKSRSAGIESNKYTRRSSLVIASKKFVSTLSPQYDLNTRDKSWVCALCQKGPHYKGLGDLYGPYYINSDEKEKAFQSPSTAQYDSVKETIDAVVANELFNDKKAKTISDKRRKSDSSDSSTKRQRQSSRNSQTNDESHTNSHNTPTEVWVHEDCIVWSNNVYLVGHRVRNLEDIIADSNEHICTKCKLSGATLGCLQKSCSTSKYHYMCAKERGCDMDEENFTLYCPKHKRKAKETSKCISDEPSIS